MNTQRSKPMLARSTCEAETIAEVIRKIQWLRNFVQEITLIMKILVTEYQWIPSKNRLADVRTRALDRIKFKYLTDKITGEC
jgi:hypothetical protein